MKIDEQKRLVNLESLAKARAARWNKSGRAPEKATLDNQDLGRDEITPEELKALTPDQRRIRTNLRKAKWWRANQVEIERRKKLRAEGKGEELKGHPYSTSIRQAAKSSTREYKNEYYRKNSKKILASQAAYARRRRLEKATNHVAPPVVAQQSSDAVPCRLSECPTCGSRFYVVTKGTTP